MQNPALFLLILSPHLEHLLRFPNSLDNLEKILKYPARKKSRIDDLAKLGFVLRNSYIRQSNS